MNNDDRALKGTQAIAAYLGVAAIKNNILPLALTILIGDLRHAADEAGIDFDEIAREAERLYYADLDKALTEKNS